jgi:hypothetical protein
MPRKIRVRGNIKETLPRKINRGELELSALEVTPPSNPGERNECRYFSVCPDRKRCNGYGRVRAQKKSKFFKRCDSYSPGEE